LTVHVAKKNTVDAPT